AVAISADMRDGISLRVARSRNADIRTRESSQVHEFRELDVNRRDRLIHGHRCNKEHSWADGQLRSSDQVGLILDEVGNGLPSRINMRFSVDDRWVMRSTGMPPPVVAEISTC